MNMVAQNALSVLGHLYFIALHMEISIVIPTLNEAINIGRLLTYLTDLPNSDTFELIVVDGGSTDGTLSILHTFSSIKIICTSAGRAHQLNTGAQAASGNWLYFLHADTQPPSHLYDHIQQLEDSGYDSGCFRLRFDEDHFLLRFCAWCTRIDWNCFRYGDQSLVVKRSLFEKSGGYNTQRILLEDNDLVRRLKRLGRFSLLPAEVQTSARKYRQHGPVYLQSVYCLLYLADRLGLSQKRLSDMYRFFLKTSTPKPHTVSTDILC